MILQSKVSGVILAGGMARRMHQQDKGLVLFKQKSMISYAIEAMVSVVDELYVNANRNIQQYKQFTYPVIRDIRDDFAGPLAGVYSALNVCRNDILLVIPCDSPFVTSDALRVLLVEHESSQADIAVAFDGERIHPVFMVVRRSLKSSLQIYLEQGERKIDRWIEQHKWVKVDLSSNPGVFSNINTLEQLDDFASKES